MLTRKSETLKKLMQKAKPIIGVPPIIVQRTGIKLISSLTQLPKEQTLKEDFTSPVKGEWILCDNAPSDYALIYLHGGAYCIGDLSYCRTFASRIAQKTQLNTFYCEYSLAPEHPFPSALQDALATYFHLLDLGYSNNKIAFIGDSAGGGLALSTAIALKNDNKPLPCAIVCMSPWADLLNIGNSQLVTKEQDPILDPQGLKECAKLYAKDESLTNPLISPVYANFDKHFPSTLIHVGTNDILLSDSINLEKNMRKHNVDVTLDVFSEMWHVFHLFELPESDTALIRIKNFLHKKLGLL